MTQTAPCTSCGTRSVHPDLVTGKPKCLGCGQPQLRAA